MISFDPVPYQPPSWALKGVAPQSVPSHRIPLGRLPTPIHRWMDLPGVPEGVEIYIKRDDLTGMQLSGNKIRKLEFILAQAKAAGHDSVVTLGGIQNPGLTGNLLVERLIGAHIHLVTKEEYTRVGQAALGAALVDNLRSQGLNPYLIPVGGSSGLGTWGYMAMIDELAGQMAESNVEFTDIAMACGSGGTTAGIALGNHLSELGLRVSAYMVCDDEGYFVNYIDGLFNELGATRDRIGASAVDLCRFIQAKGAGYALSKKEELQTVTDVAMNTGIVLDPVYTGKAVHRMLEEMNENPEDWKGRKVLFVHTGGLLGLYEAAGQLQPLVESSGRVHRMEVKV